VYYIISFSSSLILGSKTTREKHSVSEG